MMKKPVPIRFTEEQDRRLSELAAAGDFSKQELVRIAVDKLLDRLEAGEELVVQKILRIEPKVSAEKPPIAANSAKRAFK